MQSAFLSSEYMAGLHVDIIPLPASTFEDMLFSYCNEDIKLPTDEFIIKVLREFWNMLVCLKCCTPWQDFHLSEVPKS